MSEAKQGADAFAALEALEKQTGGVIDAPPVPEPTTPAGEDTKPKEAELPLGFQFVPEFKQRHMLTFYEENINRKRDVSSRFGTNQTAIEAAIVAGWFSQPGVLVVPEGDKTRYDDALRFVGDMAWDEVEQLATAILRAFSNTVNLKKK